MTDSRFSAAVRFARTAGQPPPERPGVRTHASRDHGEIRRWAAEHQAEPATGDATESGPAKIAVNDGGGSLRFNFPGFGPFRPIDWEEWLAHFDRRRLVFVFEERDDAEVAIRADALSESRGRPPGDELTDWFQAERDLRHQDGEGSPSVRYRVVEEEPRA